MFIRPHEFRKTLCNFKIYAHDLRVERNRYELVKNNTSQTQIM